MSRRVVQKWRPSLTLVLAGTLAAVLALPLLGIGYFRIAGNVLGWGETSWLIGWLAVTATLVLAFLLWRLVLRPVQSLTRYARAAARGETTPPPSHFGTPELSELADAVITMGATLQGREAAIRTYADHVTHELKSPLTVIQGAAELLDSDLSPADRDKLLDNILAATARMDDLLDDQRALARAAEPITAGQCLLSDVALQCGAIVAQDGIVPLPEATLNLVLTHLVGNATEHAATEVVVSVVGDVLTVSDNGTGITQGNRSRIFDPFFTTRRSDGGTGMGLAIVRRIVAGQGAEITLLDSPSTTFEIRF